MSKFRSFVKRGLRKIENYRYNNNDILVRSIINSEAKLNIFGYFDYIFSISSNARDFVSVVGVNNADINLVPLRMLHKDICKDQALLEYYSMPSKVANFNLWFVSFDMLESCYKMQRKWFNGRYNLAVFWWEFDDYFTNVACFDFLDEIVVFSSITYKALEKVIPKHVKLTRLEYPFLTYSPQLSRNEVLSNYDLGLDRVYTLFVFDMHSYIERKNPYGVLSAFNSALQQNKSLYLILKITNFDLWRKDSQDLLLSIKTLGLSKSVTIISDNLTEQEMRELIGCCDIYISLHRAEGLGLGMLEAMSLGKPVIATRFGGNLDFMNDDNSLLVDYTLTEVKKSFAAYQKGYLWAEPDVDMAAKYLLELSTNVELYATISTKAKESIRIQYDALKLKNQYQEFFMQFMN